MPQRWVARFRTQQAQARAAVVTVALVVAAGLLQPTTALAASPTDVSTAEASPNLSLPWGTGDTWRLTGGPHSNIGRGRPWSSLDFAGPVPGHSYMVRAAADGTVVRPCANFVQIKHVNGWTTGYYHVRDIRVRAGDHVDRGQVIGWTSADAGCGGSATGPHVHFSVQHNGSYVNLRGMTIGGWTVRDGASQYTGCLVRGARVRCPPSGRLYNSGAIGSSG